MNSDDFIGFDSNGSSPRSENDTKKPCLNPSELNYQNGVDNHTILEESSYQVESNITLENVNECVPKQHRCSSIDGNPITGAKRARRTNLGQDPSVHVVYNFLTRESKKKLVELLQQWSEWHAQHQPYHKVSSKKHFESGEETYFPALHVGSDKPFAVSFWLDSKARKEDEDTQLNCDSVPLYDRGYTLGSNGIDASHNSESGVKILEVSRCFNCSSYGHSLKDCPKPRDNVAINNARKQHSSSKPNSSSGSRGQVRYYVKTPGKFDDLKAGFLGPETRESLGIGEFDPPPWLHRMREIGYPPAYLDVAEEVPPSGITIFADEEEVKEEFEEGELPEKSESIPEEKKMTVDFPGINAPIPENADQRRWAASSTLLHCSSTSSRGHSSARSHHSSDSNRDYQRDHRREYHNDGQPLSERGFASSYQAWTERGFTSFHNGLYDSSPLSGTPSLSRSISDRGWRSPLSYENRSPHSPQYSSPSFEKWNGNMSPYGSSPGISSRHKYDKHEHQKAPSRK